MSQIWLFFVPGAGGDGVANLLEYCNGIQCIDDYRSRDGTSKGWRIQRIVDGEIKFWAPTVDMYGCFRCLPKNPFLTSNNMIKPGYESAIFSGKSVIVTSHDIDLEGLTNSDRKDIFCQDQVTVLLECHDRHRSYVNRKKKNLQEFPSQYLWDTDLKEIDGWPIYPDIDHSKFDHVLYIEDIKKDFSPLNLFLKKVGLELDMRYYDQYIELINGNLESIRTDAPCYNSYIDDGTVKYYQADSMYKSSVG